MSDCNDPQGKQCIVLLPLHASRYVDRLQRAILAQATHQALLG